MKTKKYPIYSNYLNMLVISFSYLIVLAKASSIRLNRYKESRHLYVVLNLRYKEFSFSLLSLILLVGFCVNTFYLVEEVSSIPSLLRVIMINECIFSNTLTSSTDRIMWIFLRLSIQEIALIFKYWVKLEFPRLTPLGCGVLFFFNIAEFNLLIFY